MNKPLLLGLVLGALIGGVYVALQRADLRRKGASLPARGMLPMLLRAGARLLFLVAAWWLAFRFTEADKYWLTGTLAVAYSLPLIWQLKQMGAKKE
ncbi:MAG: hypothetical protein FJ395_02375 [Verrucomicrobia bacterium]|nr:hypothetical protein [Verrucomicrobiota bacterium]